MIEFIIEYWIEFLFGLAIAGLSFSYKSLSKKLKEQEDVKKGLLAILHDRLYQECNRYLELGYIPLERAEEILDNLKILYKAYHSLGGNGTGTNIYERTLELPLKKGEQSYED